MRIAREPGGGGVTEMSGLGVVAWLCLGALVEAAHDSERILLREVQALTLYNGRYTNGRRTNPVPQLQCVGGTAGCTSFIPQVVQCYNKGWDGYDVQWECKADMDIAYRFGAITVSCEGYNYPEDPYILRGSCGLEYVIDLTEEGHRRKKDNSGFVHRSSNYENPVVFSNSSDIMVVLLLFGLAYLVYMTCLRNQQNGNQPGPEGDDDFHSTAGPSTCPPPPGFRPAYTGYTANEGYYGKANQNSGGYQPGRSSRPGFWTGVGAGGLLGYLFGSRRSQPSNSFHPYHRENPAFYPQQRQENNWKPENTGSRTVSGFGGTKRR
ncbi:store-operated calcium entry-associated regulatory factor [Pristis pectinata]|uniref:store-operated calcium entry-associated regulatory factor n=1 Tax=Pristis pectinata TaxID=685728 RepID=UPI00223CAABF|nr:store-operated calcium entry-associated regulatory factor [Pristis pectinata]